MYRANPKDYDWVPTNNVSSLYSIQGLGAGQVRSNGRFIAYYNHQNIINSVMQAVTKISQLIPVGSKYAIDTNKDGVEYPFNVNVFASVAGGTGSGMLVDTLNIIRMTLMQNAQTFKLYPWIILPEVFKAMNSGPSMANVCYNSYGALRTLDYIMHHNPKDPAINFGYTTIDAPIFDYAYVINNTNQAGVSFDTLGDLVDVVAKCAFLPSNEMGTALTTPFDNIEHQKIGGAYDILNKQAWAASAGSAELVYDSRAVARAIACSLASGLCESMLHSDMDGTLDANRFFDDSNVMIRENNGRDDIINSLLSPSPLYELQLDENTTEMDINNYLEDNYGQNNLEKDLKEALDKKLGNTKKYFDIYVSEIMKRPKGKIDAAIKFVDALLSIIEICKGEMVEEAADYRSRNEIPQQWDTLLNGMKNKGIVSFFGQKVNEDGKQSLTGALIMDIINHREEIRRDWALKFYNAFEEILRAKKASIENLSNAVESISKDYSARLLAEQHCSKSKSKFQIFLHGEDVMNASCSKVDETVRTEFVDSLKGDGLAQWIGLPKKHIEQKIWNFVKELSVVKEALKKTIDDVMENMPEDKLEDYLEHLKVLASPLWTYNTQGYNRQNLQLDRFVVVGVNNRDLSVLSTNPKFSSFFDTKQNKASFASTNQYDRVYLLIVEDLLPIYAINNFMSYMNDADQKVAADYKLACYIDEKLDNRMKAENFSLIPTQETDDVLMYWVWGFVFGYIHFDSEQNQYWMRSKLHGNAIKKYRYNLGSHREVAFDSFKGERLYEEVKTLINQEIAKNGRKPIDDKIDEIKAEESYMDKYAQISPLEYNNLEEPNFKAVNNLVTQEIRLMTK